jgi:hypothetical protein
MEARGKKLWMKEGTLDRRNILLGAALAAASSVTFRASLKVAHAQKPTTTQSPPNVLFILSDNVGYGVPSSSTAAFSTSPRRASIGSLPRGCG